MKAELEKLLLAERRSKRYLAELRTVRAKLMHELVTKERDAKIFMIDAEIASLLK